MARRCLEKVVFLAAIRRNKFALNRKWNHLRWIAYSDSWSCCGKWICLGRTLTVWEPWKRIRTTSMSQITLKSRAASQRSLSSWRQPVVAFCEAKNLPLSIIDGNMAVSGKKTAILSSCQSNVDWSYETSEPWSYCEFTWFSYLSASTNCRVWFA